MFHTSEHSFLCSIMYLMRKYPKNSENPLENPMPMMPKSKTWVRRKHHNGWMKKTVSCIFIGMSKIPYAMRSYLVVSNIKPPKMDGMQATENYWVYSDISSLIPNPINIALVLNIAIELTTPTVKSIPWHLCSNSLINYQIQIIKRES